MEPPRLTRTASAPPPTAQTVRSFQPPAGFGTVEPGVYRSKTFQPKHFEFVQSLGLRTIVYLSPDLTLRAVTDFIAESEINLIPLGLKSMKPSGWKPMSEDLVKEAIEIVLDASYHPVLLMCSSGVHQTGTVVGCLRRVQQWSFTSVLDELRNHAGRTHIRYANKHFIELFDTDLINVPHRAAPWFLRQQSMLELEASEMASLRNVAAAGAKEVGDEVVLPAYKRFYFDANGPLVVKSGAKGPKRD